MGILDGRDHAQVNLTAVEPFRDLGGNVALQAEERVAPQSVNDGGHVQVGHDAQAQGVRRGRAHHSLTTLKTVSRSRGRRPASRISRQRS